MNLRSLVLETVDVACTVNFLQRIGLLHSYRDCPHCEASMRLKKVNSSKSKDGFVWRCRGKRCNKELGLRTGTFFSRSKLDLATIITEVYLWCNEMATVKASKKEAGLVSHGTITDWKNFCRDICAEYFLKYPCRIGGENKIVEIDESCFVRRKFNVGRLVKTQWVFGGYDVETKDGFLVAVEDRTAATLLPIIEEFILPGSIIVSDLWKAYDTISNLGYLHLRVNHSLNFVDPTSGACTNHVERMWGMAKQRNKRECGTARTVLDSYLIEFMWRMKFKENVFEKFVEHVKIVYPVN